MACRKGQRRKGRLKTFSPYLGRDRYLAETLLTTAARTVYNMRAVNRKEVKNMKCDACKTYTSKLHDFHEDEWTIYQLCDTCASEYDDDVGISSVSAYRRKSYRSSYKKRWY